MKERDFPLDTPEKLDRFRQIICALDGLAVNEAIATLLCILIQTINEYFPEKREDLNTYIRDYIENFEYHPGEDDGS